MEVEGIPIGSLGGGLSAGRITETYGLESSVRPPSFCRFKMTNHAAKTRPAPGCVVNLTYRDRQRKLMLFAAGQ